MKRKSDAPADDVLVVPDTRLRAGEPSRLDSEAERERQRAIARATAAKIDEIELAMASDIFDDEPAWGSARRPAAANAPVMNPLDAEEPLEAPVPPASAPAVEESAILYANGQAAAAESLLRDSLADFGRAERLPWWMLFDLYQATGRETDFDSLAIDYASHFETSPPAWQPLLMPTAAPAPVAAVAASEAFGAVLDSAAGARLQRLLASPAPLVRIDLGALRSATPEGCAALLSALQALRKEGRELVLAGADTLLGVLRPMLAVGDRGAGEAPWLLLLELLLLSNREKDFEESAMDYCVTFEVSPPSFETPKRVSTAAPAPASRAGGDRFLLPPVAGAANDPLLDAVDAYAEGRELLVLDCSRLARMDFACATALQSRLSAHVEAGRAVELRELNHLVAALLRLLGYGDGIRLYPHRY
ncbi:STAS domain-containing protein [uncultured Massilia sp.]|uniref:STAS domain-containing protein n=1 Tax=uncultured Massilia sp. TaxID=169973 RepID=UPI002587BF4B|nr:STAS domain-containing protein [uncultured Massilia sp.]